jgi:hypothetical protein
MKRTASLVFSLILAAAGSACAPDDSGSSAQPSGAVLGADGSSVPAPEEPLAPSVAPAETASDSLPVAAPVVEAAEPEPAPAEPFNVQIAAKVLDQPLERAQEAVDEHTVEYKLVGATSSAVIAQTQWSTAPEAEFECERAAVGAQRIVGSDRILYVTQAGVWLAKGATCTQLSVSAGSEYSASLTNDFAQDVFGAP